MKFSPKLSGDNQQKVYDMIINYAVITEEKSCLMVSDGEMSRIVKEAGYDVSVSYIQRARKSLGIGSCQRDYTIRELRSIGNIIMVYAQWDTDIPQMTVTDADMCRILIEEGYSVNPVFVQRTRQKMDINARGTKLRKFTETQLKEIQGIIREFTMDKGNSWQLTVSDAEMGSILGDQGFLVNVKYVERLRRSLGIEPLGERGGSRGQDPEYVNLISLHDLDAYRLSYRSVSSGALRGQSGTDVRDRFGCHATDPYDAIERKTKELFRSKEYTSRLRPVYSDSADVSDQIEDIESIFSEEVDARSNVYGKKGKTGGVYNTRTAQVLTSVKSTTHL